MNTERKPVNKISIPRLVDNPIINKVAETAVSVPRVDPRIEIGRKVVKKVAKKLNMTEGDALLWLALPAIAGARNSIKRIKEIKRKRAIKRRRRKR